MGEILFITLVFLTMLITFCLYNFLSKRGLYFAMIIMNILTFILSFKIIYIFKLNINLGIIPLIAMFTIFYIILIKYGNKETKTILNLIFYSNIAISLFLIVMNYFIPAITETISINMKGTFEHNYKIILSYPIIILLSQIAINKLYSFLTSINNNISICIILTHIITSILYTIIFYIIIYINIITIKSSLFVALSTYIISIPLIIINLFFIKTITTNKKVKS